MKQVLEFALTSSSCYKIKKQGVILLNYCRSLKTTPPKKNWKTQFHRKKWTWWYFFSNEHTSYKFILVITVNCANQLISTLEISTQRPKKLSFECGHVSRCRADTWHVVDATWNCLEFWVFSLQVFLFMPFDSEVHLVSRIWYLHTVCRQTLQLLRSGILQEWGCLLVWHKVQTELHPSS